MNTSQFYYDLPEKLIAQSPTKDRSTSRMMLIDKKKQSIEHKHFYDIVNYLNPEDCLVLNDTKVLPARLIGEKEQTKARIELLLLKRISHDEWETLVKPGKRLKTGDKIIFGANELHAEIIEIKEDGNRIVKFFYDGIFEEVLDKLGEMPLPPYIKERLNDGNRYQTVYAKNTGSAAAPTAGLHFTDEILNAIKAMGVKIATVTLHVGLGTFRPVKVTNVQEHKMHSEFFNLEPSQAEIINNTIRCGGRIICVGTTSVRTIETCADEEGYVNAKSGYTEIFIYPSYSFKAVNGIITNFHLPESTLLMLISAFAETDFILSAYKEAVQEQYRFFSFGDCMLIMDNIL